MALAARRWLSAAKASWSSREMLYFLATFSAVTPMWTVVERIAQGADHDVDHGGVVHACSPAHGRSQVGAAAHVLGAAGHRRVGVARA